MSSVKLEVSFEWTSLGRVRIDDGGRLAFPRASARPGVYVLAFDREEGRAVYIGETDQIDRRFQHYRTPGPSQSTNIRLNALMREGLLAGSGVSVSTLSDSAIIRINGRAQAVNLSNAVQRILLENAALLVAHTDGATVLNI